MQLTKNQALSKCFIPHVAGERITLGASAGRTNGPVAKKERKMETKVKTDEQGKKEEGKRCKHCDSYEHLDSRLSWLGKCFLAATTIAGTFMIIQGIGKGDIYKFYGGMICGIVSVIILLYYAHFNLIGNYIYTGLHYGMDSYHPKNARPEFLSGDSSYHLPADGARITWAFIMMKVGGVIKESKLITNHLPKDHPAHMWRIVDTQDNIITIENKRDGWRLSGYPPFILGVVNRNSGWDALLNAEENAEQLARIPGLERLRDKYLAERDYLAIMAAKCRKLIMVWKGSQKSPVGSTALGELTSTLDSLDSTAWDKWENPTALLPETSRLLELQSTHPGHLMVMEKYPDIFEKINNQ